jgi:hypothetical protein
MQLDALVSYKKAKQKETSGYTSTHRPTQWPQPYPLQYHSTPVSTPAREKSLVGIVVGVVTQSRVVPRGSMTHRRAPHCTRVLEAACWTGKPPPPPPPHTTIRWGGG